MSQNYPAAGIDRIVACALDDLRESGGFSINVTSGLRPLPRGFMVAVPGHEETYPELATRTWAPYIREYVERHRYVLDAIGAHGPVYLGGWLDESGALVLDVSENYGDRAYALATARARGERAIYDVAAGETVYV